MITTPVPFPAWRLYGDAAEDDAVDDRGLVAVWDEGQRRNRLGDDQVGFLADCDRA